MLAAVSLIPSLAAIAALSALTPEYTSRVQIAVEHGSSSNVQHVQPAATIQSSEFLNRVVEKLNLHYAAELGPSPSQQFDSIWIWVKSHALNVVGLQAQDKPYDGHRLEYDNESARALHARLSIWEHSPSNTFTISVWTADRFRAKRIADTIASLYVEEVEKADQDAAVHTAAQISEQLAKLKRNADLASDAAKTFREQYGISTNTVGKTAAQTLAALNSQLSQAQALALDRQSRITSFQTLQSSYESRGAASEILTSPVIAALRVQESDAARRVAEMSQRYGETHPRVVEAKAELGQVRGAIAVEIKKIASSLEADLIAAQAKERQLQEAVYNLTQQAKSLEQKEVELKQLDQTAEKENATYRDFLRHSNELSAELAGRHATVRPLASASLPDLPSYPRYSGVLLITLMGGLIAGLGWACLVELLDSGFRTGEQIESLTGRRLIGMIPTLARSAVGKSSPVRFVTEEPTSIYAEALRSVQTSISLSSVDLKSKVIMITSSVPGEGKSTFSCSLARLVARSNPNKKIVIVDCDLRRSSVQKLLAVPAAGGTIDEFLSGTKKLKDILGHEDESGLFYVPAKADTENSAELLASEKMSALIDALANEFDLVFLDTPPLMAVSDPRIIAQFANYVVFLIQWERTERDLAVTALSLLPENSQIGVVLSQVNLRKHVRYGYADYGTYYSKYKSYYTRS